MKLQQKRKVQKVKILYLILSVFTIVSLMFDYTFALEETPLLEDTTEESKKQEALPDEEIEDTVEELKKQEIQPEEVAEEEPTEEAFNRAGDTYEIDIGSATLESQVEAIPGVVFNASTNRLHFGIEAKATYILTGTTRTRTIEVERDATVHLILDTLSVITTLSPIRVRGTANIVLRNRNHLECTNGSPVGFGNTSSGIHVASTGSLILDGETNGQLVVMGGAFGAGIGSGAPAGGGRIEIRGGTIEATGGFTGAGIGTAAQAGTDLEDIITYELDIHISGGNIKAIGGQGSSAGIGTGHAPRINNIRIDITGGTIEAIGGPDGAGIGTATITSTNSSDNRRTTLDITISSGNINARGGAGGAGIGTGTISGSSNQEIIDYDAHIDITGGTINAEGGSNNNFSGAGIGTGQTHGGLSNLNISIRGGNINARGAVGSAGIGSGPLANTGNINTMNIDITDGIIHAEGGRTGNIGGAGIGTGSGNVVEGIHTMNIVVSGGSITATKSTNTNVVAQHDIGIGQTEPMNTHIEIIGGSVLPTNGDIYTPTNGELGAPDVVRMVVFDSYDTHAPFSLLVYGTQGSYMYEGIAHEDGQVYAWVMEGIAANPPVDIKEAQPAQVGAPNQVTAEYQPGEAIVHGIYVFNTLAPNITNVYFEWGKTTDYGTQIPLMDQVDTTVVGRVDLQATIDSLDPGEYHYRFVMELGNDKLFGENTSFVIPSLDPSLDVIGDSIEETQEALIEGIYDLNRHTFISGQFELSINDGEWFIPTDSTPVRILDADGVDMGTGHINNTSQTPTITLAGVPHGSTIQYRMTVTSEGGSTIKEGSFTTPALPTVPITIHYVDINNNEIEITRIDDAVIGEAYEVSAPVIDGYTNVGVIIDDAEERDITKSYYRNDSVSQAHTITFVYDDTSTMLSLSVPVKMMFASFASDGGNVTAPEYEIVNTSSLPVNVSLNSFNEIEAAGLTLVQGPPQNENELQLQLLGGTNFTTIESLPTTGLLGRLEKYREENSRGTFTFGGMYRGRFGTPREPRFQAVFQFELILPEGLE